MLLRRILEKLSRNLPARNLEHNGRPYLRRYYLTTICGIRVYLHHFVDSDPDGLHNHPWRFGGSILLSGWYWQERRWGSAKVRFCNIVNGDTLHRVVIPEQLRATFRLPAGYGHYVAPERGVWTLFFHTKKVAPWATLKDKGIFIHYHVEFPTHESEDGHSSWWKSAPKGRELFG